MRARGNYFLGEMLRIEKLISASCVCVGWASGGGEGEGWLFNISKVSSREIQRHKRVTGDADSSVNSAGGGAQDVITRCCG